MNKFFSTGLLGITILAAAIIYSTGVPADDIESGPAYSVILEGGIIYDGSGNEPYEADVGIKGNEIAAIGDLQGARAGNRINVEGLAVSPGLVDIHSHAASRSFENSHIYQRPHAKNYLHQGVTTVISGQDGSSPSRIGEFLGALEAHGPAINLGLFIGHNTVRGEAMGLVDRPPDDEEMEAMRQHVDRAMQEGAFGLSSGLEYTPGAYAENQELIDLAHAIAPYDGLYISHIRDEGGDLLPSVAEVIDVGREAEVRAQVTHHKVVGPDRWGMSEESLRLIDEAREEGVDVMSDVYPYTASSTGMTILFPSWSREGGTSELRNRLEDPETREQIKEEIAQHIEAERGGDPSTIQLARCSWDDSYDGLTMADVLEERDEQVNPENAAEIAMEFQAEGGCQLVLHSMSEEDVQRIMKHPYSMIASDGGIPEKGVGSPHPRSYGTFARVLGHYVRDEEVLTLEDAIHKMTQMPAERLKLHDRGLLEEGRIADIAVFDPDEITDHATFREPHQYATGVHHVLVSGQLALYDEEPTGARPGKALRYEFDNVDGQ